jgi:hypothetical protein
MLQSTLQCTEEEVCCKMSTVLRSEIPSFNEREKKKKKKNPTTLPLDRKARQA